MAPARFPEVPVPTGTEKPLDETITVSVQVCVNHHTFRESEALCFQAWAAQNRG